MTVRFHPPENQSAYAERVLAVLAEAAMPQIMAQFEQACQQSTQEADTLSA